MIITLVPQFAIPGTVGDRPPSVIGETIRYRELDFDLSQLLDGHIVEASSPFVGVIKRTNGVVHVTLEYLVDETAATQQSTNIEDYCFQVKDGMCPCPIQRQPVQTNAEESSDAESE